MSLINFEYFNNAVVNGRQDFIDKNQQLADQFSHLSPDENNNGTTELYGDFKPFELADEDFDYVSSDLFTLAHHQVSSNYEEIGIPAEGSTDNIVDTLIQLEDIQPSVQDFDLSPFNFELLQYKPVINSFSPDSSISESQVPQKPNRMKCQCPNCRAKGGNKTIGPNGKPQHICHYPDCGKIYSATWHLKKHITLQHSEVKNFFCAHCNKGFAYKYMIKEHIEKHIHRRQKKIKNDAVERLLSPSFPIPKLQKPQKRKNRTICQCINCSAEGGNKTKGPNGRQQHICHIPNCGRVFNYIYNLKRHLIMNHSTVKKFFCSHCNKGFTYKCMMRKHVEKHMNLERKKFENNNTARQGDSISEVQIPQKLERTKCQCPNCNVDGGNKTKGPNGKLQHACHYPNCGKVYGETWHLKKHLKSHTDETISKNYRASSNASKKQNTKKLRKQESKKRKYLNRSAKNASVGISSEPGQSNKHLASHSLKKIFVCDYCQKGFHRKNILRAHVERHLHGMTLTKCQCPNCTAEGGNKVKGPSGKLQHVCHYPDCGKVYSETWHLKKHITMRHSGEKNFFCVYCNMGFAFKYMMKKHVERHINNKNNKIVSQISQSLSIFELQRPGNLNRAKCKCPNCSAEGGNKTKGPNGKLQHVCHYPYCGKVYGETWHLKRHIALLHSGINNYLRLHREASKSGKHTKKY